MTTDDDQELRIAPVMTGGTSLAVWMGGVTAELYNVVCARPPDDPDSAPQADEPTTVDVYRQLLGFTRTRARVDVVTGTSAGGLNGTLLAAAWRYQLPAATFQTIRTTWLDIADLRKLLRSPSTNDPPSLLKGDEYFRAQVESLLTGWKEKGKAADPEARPMDLLITVTTVTAEPVRRQDDFGEPMSEVNYAHRLRFDERCISDDDADWPRKLAIAGRTSACIPGVFEPSFLPITAKDATEAKLPDFTGHASFTTSKFAVDGGVVNNLPLGEALERIFFLPAERTVRRVALYISPTPAAAGASKAADRTGPPTIKESLVTLVTGPRAEGVASDIDRLRRHNTSIDDQATARRVLVKLIGGGTALGDRATQLIGEYTHRRTTTSVQQTVDSVLRSNPTLDIDRELICAALYEARRVLVPPKVANEGVGGNEIWGWGIAPVEHAASIVSGILRRTLALPDSAVAQHREHLLEQRRRLNDALAKVGTVRERDRRYWDARLSTLDLDALAERPPTERAAALAQWATESYAKWPGDWAADTPHDASLRTDSYEQLRDAFRSIAAALEAARPSVEAAASEAAKPGSAAIDVATELLRELSVLAQPGTDVAVNLRAMHVLQSATLGDVVEREQRIELMQVSFNAPNLLHPDRAPADKLAGPELGRLGAFLKRSWRANDWFWGRMDGAARLAEMLLDPRRLRQLGISHQDVLDLLRSLGCSEGLLGALTTELAYLDDPQLPTPQSLTETAKAVAEQLQLRIAREELPLIRKAIEESTRNEKANEPDGGAFRRLYDHHSTTELDVATARKLVKNLEIGTETVGTELGYGLLNRTLSHGAAVAVNAMSGGNVGVPLLPRLLKPLRTPLHAVNSLVRVTTASSPLGKAVNAFVFAICGAIVALAVTGADVPSGLLVVSEILIVAAFVLALIRTKLWWHALWMVPLALVVGLALVGGELRTVVYDETAPTDETVLPPGAQLELPDEAVIRIRSGDGDDARVEDRDVDGATIELRDGATSREVRAGQQPASWKRWGFTNTQSVANFALLFVAMWAATLAVNRFVKSPWTQLLVVLVVGAAAAFALFALRVAAGLFEAVLIGSPAESAVKRWFVARAVDLHGYELGVVLLALVTSSILLGAAYDVTIKRRIRMVIQAVKARLA